MKICIVGSGGREYALGWKIRQDRDIDYIGFAPGNGGTSLIGENIPLAVDSLEAINTLRKELVKRNFTKNDLIVIGPELPLSFGVVDYLISYNLKVFGPSQKASRIETSKVDAKRLMKKYGIPTADFVVFGSGEPARKSNAQAAIQFLNKTWPEYSVVKVDEAASGKGVYVCDTREQATKAVGEIMIDKIFSKAGNRILLEKRLFGEELSYIVLTDGENFRPLPLAKDYKRLEDGNKGPNTGGMGSVSPTYLPHKMKNEIDTKIIRRTLNAMRKERMTFKGALYAGLMNTSSGIYDIEFNCRFGDPETQSQLVRMKSDLTSYLKGCVDGSLKNLGEIQVDPRYAVCVVLASKGYSGECEKGKEITGLDKVADYSDVVVFHAGTVLKDGKFLTNGGRVLGVTAVGKSLEDARQILYQEVIPKIHFDGMIYRKDIGL